MRALLVVDDPSQAEALAALLKEEGCEVEMVAPADAQELRAHRYELIVTAAPGAVDLVARVGTRLSDARFDGSAAWRGGRKVNLRAKELELLRCLYENRPRVLSRDELLRHVWEYHEGVSTRTVDVHMASLRQKLEEDPRRPKRLQTVRGVGYRYAE